VTVRGYRRFYCVPERTRRFQKLVEDYMRPNNDIESSRKLEENIRGSSVLHEFVGYSRQ
jgi:hypothetical protein